MKNLFALLLLALLLPATVYAQTEVVMAELTTERADSLIAFFNRAGTTRLTGDARLPTESDVGDVAMLAGELILAGRVAGSVVVINGSLRFEPGARVDGDVHVIGGPVEGIEHANARSITLYREVVRYDLQDGVLVHRRETVTDELRAGRAFEFGRFDVIIAARGGYNRVEGLPVHLGGRVTLGHSNPTTFEATLIGRTADFDNPGYALRLEQFLGARHAARIGFRWADEVQDIEQWGLSDRENSLATFLLHRDYRDHYVRKGWSTYLRVARPGRPLDVTLGYAVFDVGTAVVHDPFTLFYNDDSWRFEPLQSERELTTVNARLQYDTRNDERDPAAGWLTHAAFEFDIGNDQGHQYGLIDIRRYARLSPNAKISMRAVVAGSINGDSLPAFRQQSLGAEASLPGYELHQFDCGGHSIGSYGCDRLALVQLEYQSNFRALSRVARRLGRDFGLLDNIRWVAFVNSGRAWTEAAAAGQRGRGTSDFVTDAGIGLRFGVLGVYWAFPFSDRASGANFFVRLGPRL
jgi:hypothetical protein